MGPKVRNNWKSSSDIGHLKFTTDSSGHVRKIGGHSYGRVYLGKVHFKGEYVTRKIPKNPKEGKPSKTIKQRKYNRVAIKRFIKKLDDVEAKNYQKRIDLLRNAGVDLPKTGMVKLSKGTKFRGEDVGGEWVQVSQLFGSTTNGSKIVHKSWANFQTKEGREYAIEQLTRAANAGLVPAEDLLEPFKDPKKGVIPFDIDEVKKTKSEKVRAHRLVDSVWNVARGGMGRKKGEIFDFESEFHYLLAVAKNHATPKLRKEIESLEKTGHTQSYNRYSKGADAIL